MPDLTNTTWHVIDDFRTNGIRATLEAEGFDFDAVEAATGPDAVPSDAAPINDSAVSGPLGFAAGLVVGSRSVMGIE